MEPFGYWVTACILKWGMVPVDKGLIQVIIISFDTFGLRFQKRFFLRIFDDFCYAMINRPHGSANRAFENPFSEAI